MKVILITTYHVVSYEKVVCLAIFNIFFVLYIYMQLIFFWVTQSNKTITIYAHKLSGPILNNGLIKSKQCTSTTNRLNLE